MVVVIVFVSGSLLDPLTDEFVESAAATPVPVVSATPRPSVIAPVPSKAYASV